MARRSQCSSAGDNPLDPNYLPPHYREEYRLAIDVLVEEDLEGYYQFLQKANVVDFLSTPEIDFIQHSVQAPKQSTHLEQQFLDSVGDTSSDTYWPIHSDLDVPGLDLGWPQLHSFIGPTEVTTLVNPPEPDMPSIKEQARRLIKNAQQVIAIVMDMFTDVDMFADILNAAMRNVAVYILLDKENAHHFINMVSNCRVNLQSIQFLRVRTVSGITYQCRSGKSFKGQMMDRFLLIDCRAVLSGNYSFMWSFEKLHRCMAHLFLGQLVTTFDEEFRILFAQSQPLMVENVLVPVEEFGHLHKRQFTNEKASFYREPRKFLPEDIVQPDEWARPSYDERMDGDWRMMALKRQESLRGPGDMYRRHAPQQPRIDPCFDQGPSRIPVMENPAYKRHSYAEGVPDRYSLFLQQQGMPDTEVLGKYFHKGQQPFPGPGPGPGPETNYSSYNKFWNQDYQPAEQYSEPGVLQELHPSDNFDPVLNYLSSTRTLDFDQSSEKLPPGADLPLNSSHPGRLGFGQPYVCQISPTPSNSADQKQVFQDPTTDRKDPTVKRGLRNWRISSYLSAYENPGEEGLPMVSPQTDAFEDPPNPIQQTAPDIDLPALKIPNIREFKVPAVTRVSQMPSYTKTTTQEQPNKPLNKPAAVAAEIKTTPTPSETPSTAETEKAEVMEQKESKTAGLRRDDSFRRKYNAAVPRSSRLRSSLIFSCLEQQQTPQETTSTEQPDEQSDKNEAEPTKLLFVSHALGQRRSPAREPFEWSHYAKSATFNNSSTETSKPDDESSKRDNKDLSKEEHSKDTSENPEVKESLNPKDEVQDIPSPSTSQSKPSGAEPPKTEQPEQPPKPLIKTPLYLDMNDPDNRLMVFKEIAAKRKAAKAAEAAKSKEKMQVKPPTDLNDNSTPTKEEPPPNVTSESKALTHEGQAAKNAAAGNAGEMVSTEACQPAILPVDASDDSSNKDNIAISDSNTSRNSETAAEQQPSQDAPAQAITPHDLNLTGFDASTPAETVLCSTPLESDQSALFPETKKTETDKFASGSLSDKNFLSGETHRESEDSLVQPLTHLLSCPTEATSKSSADVNLPCKASESAPALSGESSQIQPELADAGERKSHNVEDTNKSHKSSHKESVGSEQTSDQVKQSSEPTEITSKPPKLSQSRYHSSTANVLSSSNLRDDTKLLLEQISANCQSRNEATKESPVTDDEKEDEADKNAKKEKESGFRTLGRGQPKTTQEREKLLERLQNMRKERKVYSRFEMAP
ncbi:protein FAM83H [Xenentodon cancila]